MVTCEKSDTQNLASCILFRNENKLFPMNKDLLRVETRGIMDVGESKNM